jgi:hypothetical protein
MELRLLVTFEKVAGVLSFTQAAAELRYAHPASPARSGPSNRPSAWSCSTGSAAASG